MKADFYRVLFRKTLKGIYVTMSMNDEIHGEKLHAAYIAAEACPAEEDVYPLDYLAVGDFLPGTKKLLVHMLEKRKIGTVILPEGDGGDDLENACRKYGADVQTVSDALAIRRDRWELLFWTFEGDGGPSLVLYQRFVGCDRVREDCVLTGKLTHREACVPCIYGEDDYCGFGCMGKRDFDVLKAHKRPEAPGYRMGTLVLGTTRLSGQMERLWKLMEEFSDELRCICLPWGVTEESFDSRLYDFAPAEEYLYLLGHAKGMEPSVLGGLADAGSGLQFRRISGDCGFCLSGYRVPFQKKTPH